MNDFHIWSILHTHFLLCLQYHYQWMIPPYQPIFWICELVLCGSNRHKFALTFRTENLKCVRSCWHSLYCTNVLCLLSDARTENWPYIQFHFFHVPLPFDKPYLSETLLKIRPSNVEKILFQIPLNITLKIVQCGGICRHTS